MTAPIKTLDQIRRDGMEALAQALGPVGFIRFFQQYETGSGDYSADRHSWLVGDVEAVAAAIRQRRTVQG
ncbi:MAG: hypothetical protein P4L84_09745 [Isosphaeraceae bacterium]|nr:hypothetical protein [Isosphaeraceae bacterium]